MIACKMIIYEVTDGLTVRKSLKIVNERETVYKIVWSQKFKLMLLLKKYLRIVWKTFSLQTPTVLSCLKGKI